MEFAQDDFPLRFYFVEIDYLASIAPSGIGVVENPPSAGQERAMAVEFHPLPAHDLDRAAGLVLKQVEAHAKRVVPRPREQMAGVAPDKVRRFSIRIDQMNVSAVGPGGQHSGSKASQPFGPPAVQEDESGAVGIEQQVVEVVFWIPGISGNIAEFGDVREGYYQVLTAGLKVNSEDA